MSTTLQSSLDYASSFVGYLGLAIGTNNQPSLGSVRYIVDTVLSAPFMWAWNRNSTKFQTTTGTQDYSLTLSDFGYIETATAQPCAVITAVSINETGLATLTAVNQFVQGNTVTVNGLATTSLNGIWTITAASPTSFSFLSPASPGSLSDSGLAVSGQVFQFEDVLNTQVLSESSDLARPTKICVLTDNLAGAQKVRLMSVPDQPYNIVLQYQKDSPTITNLSGNWPFPDDFTDIYNALFIGMSLEYAQDPRGVQWLTRGTAALIRKAEGLSEMDKQYIMGAFIPGMMLPTQAQLKTQQGIQARAQG